jgi:hypothetical protein
MAPKSNKAAAVNKSKSADKEKGKEKEKDGKEPHKIKAPIDRALKAAKLIDRHAQSLKRLVENWQGEATDDQQETCNETTACMVKVAGFAARVLLNVDTLKASGFQPTVNLRASVPLPAGTRVRIKDDRFNEALYGKINDFEVVISVDKQVRIRSNDTKAGQPVVMRSWLEIIGDAAPTEEDLEDEEDATDPDGEEDDSPE